ncbi:MAG TPA: AIM24 family protein [Candidatus Dormibacteraeota bacterium]|nr:AIM24 family protein [Candidatus Dormibacteraeota bacterium]HVD03892.1 AIM24 family protein [Candidatus Dormibacteraeota bacterium]
MTVTHKLVGSSTQMVVCQLAAGQTVYAQAGRFLWKTVNVSLETRLTGSSSPTKGGGGLLGMALEVGKRAVAGQSLAFQYFTASGGNGLVAFSGALPGELRAIELDGSSGWLAEKDTLIAAEGSVNFDIAFQGLRTGRRGGTGFVLEKFTGSGTVLIGAAGNLIELNPAKYGGKIQVHTGAVVAFQETVNYGVEYIGGLSAQTAMTAVFGGEGINLATLEGDGSVLLQSANLHALAETLDKLIANPGEDRGRSAVSDLFG